MALSWPRLRLLIWIAISFTFCNAAVVPLTLPLSDPFTGYSVQIFPGNSFQNELNSSWGPLLDRLGAQATTLTAPNNADLFNSTPSTTAADFPATLQAARTGCNLPLGITPAVVQVMNNAIYSSFKEWNGPYVFQAGVYGSAPDPEVTFELLASDGAEKVASVDACPAGPQIATDTDATAIATDDDVVWDNLKKRSSAGEFTHYHEWRILQALRKRAGEDDKPRKGIDTCAFVNGVSVTYPNYWSGGDIKSTDQAIIQKNPASIIAQGDITPIQRWYVVTRCDNPLALIKGAYPFNPANKKYPDSVSIDHVYEKSFVVAFLRSKLRGDLSCTLLNRLFIQTRQPSNPSITLMQLLFNQVASKDHLEFAGVDKLVNGAKGGFFRDTGVAGNVEFVAELGLNAPGNPIIAATNAMSALENLALAFDFVNRPEIARLFDNTNQRIYKTLVAIGDLVVRTQALSDAQGATTVLEDIADAYKAWMTAYIPARTADALAFAKTLSDQVNLYLNGLPQAQKIRPENLQLKKRFAGYRTSTVALKPATRINWPLNFPEVPIEGF